MRKIAVVTGTRAEYGLLEPILRLIENDASLRLQLIVTGAHLEARLGMTVREIVKDGFKISARVPMALSEDSSRGVASAMGRGMIGFSRAYAKLKPDMLVVLGDRYEVLAAASAALPFKIPVAHLHGGEASEGVWDESIRHAVTKLSHLHFAALPAYAKRIKAMGEDPGKVFCFGSPAKDRIRNLPRLSRGQLEKSLGLPLERPVGVVTYHPDTLDRDNGAGHAAALLAALKERKGTWILTYPNADAGGRGIIAQIKRFAGSYKNGRAKAFSSLGQLRYFSLLAQADVLIGNSSSGILESPYFGIPTVNVGQRQQGRVRMGNVLDVPRPSRPAVRSAVARALSPAFKKGLRSRGPKTSVSSPSRAIVRVLKTIRLDENLLKKKFHEN